MTQADLKHFRDALRIKQAELALRSRRRENIAIERSADVLEEADFKSARELAIADLNRAAVVRRDIALALTRLENRTFGECVHCGAPISQRRLEAVPWTPFCIRCQEAADLGDENVLESVEPSFLDVA